MSCQRGNASRSRPQKYKNQTAFKNDLHDKSQKTKTINNIDVANVCERCKKIIEWKIKYKKYKPLKAPAKCTKCEEKTIRHAYHIVCLPCAKQHEICPKCTEKAPIVEAQPKREETFKLDGEFLKLLKKLPERRRRTFIRYVNRQGTQKKKNIKDKGDLDGNDENDEKTTKEEDVEPVTREDLLNKLKDLVLKDGKDEDDFGSDLDDDYDSDCST